MQTQPELRRGQLHWVDWHPARGSEQAGRRPALIVSNDRANRHSPRVNVVALTSQTFRYAYPFHIPVAADAANGLRKNSIVMCEQVMSIAKERLDGNIGVLPSDVRRHVDQGLRISMAL